MRAPLLAHYPWDERLAALRHAITAELARVDNGDGSGASALLNCLDAAQGITVSSTVARLEAGLAVRSEQALHPRVLDHSHPRTLDLARDVLHSCRDTTAELYFPNDGLAVLALEMLDDIDDKLLAQALVVLFPSRMFSEQRQLLEIRRPHAVSTALASLRWWERPSLDDVNQEELKASLISEPWQFHSGSCDPTARAKLGDNEIKRHVDFLLSEASGPVQTLEALMLLDPIDAEPHLRRLVENLDALGQDARNCFVQRLADIPSAHVLSTDLVRAMLADDGIAISTRVALLTRRPDAVDPFAPRLWEHPWLGIRDAQRILNVDGDHRRTLTLASVANVRSAKHDRGAAVRLAAVFGGTAEDLITASCDEHVRAAARSVAADQAYPARLRWLAIANVERRGERVGDDSDPVIARYRGPVTTRDLDVVDSDLRHWLAD